MFSKILLAFSTVAAVWVGASSLPTQFDAFVPSNTTTFLSNFHATPVPYSDIHKVVESLNGRYRKTFDYAKRVTAPNFFTHDLRIAHFALALLYNGFPTGTPSVEQIGIDELTERLYLTVLLHDIALTYDESALAHPARNMSFELYGGIMAYEHLVKTFDVSTGSSSRVKGDRKHLTPVGMGDIVQGIMFHTHPFDRGNSSASAALLQYSAFFDIMGYDAFGPGTFTALWDREFVREVEADYPRGGLGQDIKTMFLERELRDKPSCLVGHGDPSWPLAEAVLRKSLLD